MENVKKILLVSCVLALASAAAHAQVNDVCSGATPMTCGNTESGSTSLATFDGVGFCGTANTAPGVWYSFVGDGSVVTASTCNSANYDTKISVFSGGCAGLTCVDGEDDTSGCSGFTTELSWCTEPGVEYFILVHGFVNATGDFDLSISCAPTSSNDDVCDALSLGVGSTGFSNRCVSAEPGESTPPGGSGPSSCNSQDGWCDFPSPAEPGVQNSIWYSLDVPATTSVGIETSGFDTQLALWAADTCGDLTSGGATLIAANDDSGAGVASFVGPVYCLSPGENYWVQVDGWNGAEGEGTITVTELDKKVTLCHDTNGRDPRTITVNACAAQDHLEHGDVLGECPPACEDQEKVVLCHHPESKTPVTLEVSACAAPSHFAHGDRLGDCALLPLTLTLTTDSFGGETSWVLVDLTDNVIVDSRGIGALASNTTFVDEYFVDSNHCFEYTIVDSFGDGICCSFGLGDYSLTLDDTTVDSPSGGAFGLSETVQIGNCP
jgi:hypothetical protein